MNNNMFAATSNKQVSPQKQQTVIMKGVRDKLALFKRKQRVEGSTGERLPAHVSTHAVIHACNDTQSWSALGAVTAQEVRGHWQQLPYPLRKSKPTATSALLFLKPVLTQNPDGCLLTVQLLPLLGLTHLQMRMVVFNATPGTAPGFT